MNIAFHVIGLLLPLAIHHEKARQLLLRLLTLVCAAYQMASSRTQTAWQTFKQNIPPWMSNGNWKNFATGR